jgi:hypothetical protein
MEEMEEHVHCCSNYIHCVSELNFLSRHRLTLFSPLASSMFAPGISDLMAEFHSNSDALASFVFSVTFSDSLSGISFSLQCLNYTDDGFCTSLASRYSSSSPLLVRCLRISTCLLPFDSWLVLSEVPPLRSEEAFIADLFPPEERALAISLYTLGPMLAPAIGPVIGGFLSQAKGWRWVFWLMTIIVRLVISNCEIKYLLTWCLRMALFSCPRLSSCPKHMQPRSFHERPTN